MIPPNVDVPDWHRATALNERIALLRAQLVEQNKDLPDSDRARRWRAQSPFSDPALFEQRLRSDGLQETEWQRLVSEPESTVRERAGAPPWFVPGLVAAYQEPSGVDVTDLLPSPEALNQRVRGASGLLAAVEPLLAAARSRLREGLRERMSASREVPFDPAVVERLWLQDLPADLLAMIDRTLVLEMHVARMQGALAGETPEERFASFVLRLRDPEVMLAIFREYPVLARCLWNAVEQCVAFGLEFFGHLLSDWALIKAEYAHGEDPGELVFLEGNAGDPHRGGRSVVLMRFANGMRLVYKPKSLSVDVHFQELIEWLNARGLTPQLRSIRVIDRGAYGYIEHVDGATCGSEDEVKRFYRRQGRWCCSRTCSERRTFITRT
ncbi:MAG: DUF4135 domain-containing protein [Polyangiaceae bacterium]